MSPKLKPISIDFIGKAGGYNNNQYERELTSLNVADLYQLIQTTAQWQRDCAPLSPCTPIKSNQELQSKLHQALKN